MFIVFTNSHIHKCINLEICPPFPQIFIILEFSNNFMRLGPVLLITLFLFDSFLLVEYSLFLVILVASQEGFNINVSKKSDWDADPTKSGPILPIRVSELTCLGPKWPGLFTHTSLSHWMEAVLGSTVAHWSWDTSWKCWLLEISVDCLPYSQAGSGWPISVFTTAGYLRLPITITVWVKANSEHPEWCPVSEYPEKIQYIDPVEVNGMTLAIFCRVYTRSLAYYGHHLATFEETSSLWKTTLAICSSSGHNSCSIRPTV